METSPRGFTTETPIEFPTLNISAEHRVITKTTEVEIATAVIGTDRTTTSWIAPIVSTVVPRGTLTMRLRDTTTKTVTQGIRRHLAKVATDERNKVQRKRRNRDQDPGRLLRQAAPPADLHPDLGLEAAPARRAVRHPERRALPVRRNPEELPPVININPPFTPKTGDRWRYASGIFLVGRRIPP